MIPFDPRSEVDADLAADARVSGSTFARTHGREAAPSEGLFAFVRQHDRFTCELRKVGRWGIEARFLRNHQFLYSRRHKTRELAIEWAEAERKALEGNPRYRDDLKPLGWPARVTAESRVD